MSHKPKQPTKAEQRWMNAISELGCIVCRVNDGAYVPCHVHHLIRNGQRIDHMHTIGLCPTHHNSGMNNGLYVSRHPWRREFEKRYGTEQQLLEATKKLLEKAT